MGHISKIGLLFLSLCTSLQLGLGQNDQGKLEKWTSSEYSGSRTKQDVRTAMASKGFTWLSGSPADNEILSVGKNAQFFGFVALRYESGRAANRGVIGRAFYSLVEPQQRNPLITAVVAEAALLQEWWGTRKEMLRVLETHLYTGDPINQDELAKLGAQFSKLGAEVAILEAMAFAKLEDSLNETQMKEILAWRADPELAYQLGQDNLTVVGGLDGRDQIKQLEDLFAKSFSWITGSENDNEVIPLGQPAQFFGFVAIRQKSGHAANRGKIAKSFLSILQPRQVAMIDQAIKEHQSVGEQFLRTRSQFLKQLQLLRTHPDEFSFSKSMEIAETMGVLEARIASIEAQVYRKIRDSLSEGQEREMMELRGEYILDPNHVEDISQEERGAQLIILCVGCHGLPGQYHKGMPGPNLEGLFDRPIASASEFQYSEALQKRGGEQPWTMGELDSFLEAPKTFAPGTKMEFQGLLTKEDRTALIHYLQKEY